MEEKVNVIENESKIVNEEELKSVAGGKDTADDDKCFFLPEKPFQYSTAYGAVAVKCKSSCFSCACRYTVYCTDRWHLMERDPWEGKKWFAMPRYIRNHEKKDKIVEPLDI